MLSESHSCPFWVYDDITRCSRDKYLDFGVPLALLAASSLVLVVKCTSSILKQERNIKLEDGETRPLLSNSEEYGSIAVEETTKDAIKKSHFDLSRLDDTGEDGSPHGHVKEVYRNGCERFRVSLEYLLVTLQFGITLSSFFVGDLRKEWHATPSIPVVKSLFWGYLFAICTIRGISFKKLTFRLPNLWVHSTTLYFFNFFPAILIFRSVLIGHIVNKTVRTFYITEFVISSILLLLNFTATVGDKPSELYITNDGVKPSPENISSILSFTTYSWIDKMVFKAYKRPLALNDIWSLRRDDYALYVLKSFEANKSTAKFTIKLFSHFKYLFGIQAFWAVIESVIIFIPSLLLKRILEYVDDPISTPKNLAWTLVCLLPLIKILDSIASGCSLFLGRRVCVRMKAIIIGEIYAKALRRKIIASEATKKDEDSDDKAKKNKSKKDKKKKDDKDDESSSTAELGAIINLMSIDAFKVSEICGYLHFFVGAFFMIIICVVLLYGLLGWSALVGAVSIVALLPLNYKVASYIGSLQKIMLGITDKRIQKLNETFQSIRIIKFFAWENNFLESIMKVRNDELYQLKMRLAVWAAGAFIWFITPTLITLLSFYCYTIVAGHTLTAPIAFTALSLFTLLRTPLDQLADMTSFVVQTKVSLDRVADFLNEEETSKYDQLGQAPGPNSPYVGFENASFSWNSKSENDFKLRDINIDFKSGKLNVIVGPTGSGKTSLLLALLGEMDLISGKVFLPGVISRDQLVVDPQTGLTESVAYCSQSAWLLNDTIKNNITFSAPFNQDRYDKVVDACGLKRDLEILSAGDATQIGEKGITLSGGQKQRVSLARALYSNSKHVLLDDCLSAVDSHTALWIYDNCISGPLMENRTCILVSHNVALAVQKAEWLVVMENGRVKTQGSAEDLLKSGDLGDDDLVASSVTNSRSQSSLNLKSLEDKNSEMKAKNAVIEAKLQSISDQPEDIIKTDGKLVEDEEKADGVVGLNVYKGYAKFLGGFSTWSVILLAYGVSQFVFMFQSWWLRNWSLHSEEASQYLMSEIAAASGTIYDVSGLKQLPIVSKVVGASGYVLPAYSKISTFKDGNNTLYYIIIYAVIGVSYSFFACVRVAVTFFAGIRASNRIFKKVLTSVLGAKLRFFDKTPQGRIMNRFSKDIESVDQELTPFAEGAFICIVQCVSTLFLITFITPGFLIFAFIISFLYYLVGKFYITLSRELKRFESITKSPIHQHFSESLTGVASIRAYGVETRFMRQNLRAIDNNNKPFFYLWVANRWLSFRIDLVGSLVMFFAGVFVLISINRIDAGLAGLSLSYAIAFSESALWVVRLYATVEMNMNSFERLQEYFAIEQEPPHEIPETEPRASWPERGEINVKDVSLRYAPELPRVIKNVTFDVEPRNKIGIVGRTGAGKSTIITAFFRFLDPETGSIFIDGVDITKIGLRNLRQAITIIPQDPTLFTGTIRSNLDPFDQYTDTQIYESLRRVNLISSDEMVARNTKDLNENANKFINLDSAVSEGGNNLSQGQRQLMCLARSLLKSPKVILLDEATASIDYKSDAMIQQTIRQEFSNSTILTIAHRLRSIVDYDKILVMDAGRVVEYDDPYTLIADKNSLFYSMCENSGELDSLTKLAKESFVKSKNKAIRT